MFVVLWCSTFEKSKINLILINSTEGVVAEEPVDYPEPPELFLSYQWGHQNEVKLIQRHLEMAGYKCWMDVGQMGGGDKLFEKIDSGIRAAKVVVCCVTEKYAKSPNCNREVNFVLKVYYKLYNIHSLIITNMCT